MKIFMLVNTMATLYFTPNQPTTLQFQHPVEYYSLGNADMFDTYLTKNSKILLIRPKKEKFDEILVVITKNHSYEFRLKSNPKKLTALYQILDGKGDKFFTLKLQSKQFRVLEGRTMIKIMRTSGSYLEINDIKSSKKIIMYPKNAFLKVNGIVIE